MNLLITFTQIVLSLLLVGLVLLQNKGTGLGAAWGGSGGSYHTRRGAEQVIFVMTIVVSGVFFAVSLLHFVLF
jgi:protein translocase SecG subunit